MNEHESPPFWEGVDEDSFVMPSEREIETALESTAIIQHVASHISTRGHLAVIESHEPMETSLHDDSEYLKIADSTVRRIVKRHRRAMKSNLH